MPSGSIIKRGSSYLLKYDLPRDFKTGKRQVRYKTLNSVTKKEAQEELVKLLNEVNQGTHVDQKKMSLGEWLEVWLNDYSKPNVSPKTFERYGELVRLHLTPYLGTIPLQRLSAVAIQDLYVKLGVSGRRSRRKPSEDNAPKPLGLSPQSILHVHRCLSLSLTEAVRARVIARNPAMDVKPPRPKVSRDSSEDAAEKIQALDRDRLNELIEGFKGHDLFTFVALSAGTGARRGELGALTWSSIDFENKTLSITRSVEDTNEIGARLKNTKNKSSKRKIGIDENLISLLRTHKSKQAEDALKLGKKLPSDTLIFPKSILEPYAPYAPRNFTKVFIKKAKQLGFPGFHLHDLRHTHATLLLTAGVPINAVSQRLGHSSPIVTLTTYGHVLKRSEDQAVNVTRDILKETLGSSPSLV